MEEDLFPAADFDHWAATYDSSVVSTRGFPFEGYDQVLDRVVQFTDAKPGMNILDLGTGTGLLAARFTALGCNLWCTDFSAMMLEKARARLPNAHFAQHDLRQPWQSEWQQRFDRIVSAYVFHHFEDEKKIELILSLIQDRLVPGGILVIADIGFKTQADWEHARQISGADWEEELYWLADRILPQLLAHRLSAVYNQVSYCAGVYCLRSQIETILRE